MIINRRAVLFARVLHPSIGFGAPPGGKPFKVKPRQEPPVVLSPKVAGKKTGGSSRTAVANTQASKRLATGKAKETDFGPWALASPLEHPLFPPLERCCSIGCSRAPESSDNCPFGVECCAQQWVCKASGWAWRGAIFMCLLVHRLRWSAATPSSTARVPSTTPPLPLLGLAAGSSQRCSSPMTCGTPPQASLSATTAAARDRLASCARPRRQQQLRL